MNPMGSAVDGECLTLTVSRRPPNAGALDVEGRRG
jgi:hypothetical protein